MNPRIKMFATTFLATSLVTILVGISLTTIAFGEDLDIPEVKVTYTRGEQDPKKIPASVTIIDRDVIEKSGATDVPDLLKREAGINVINMIGSVKFSGVDMRGFTDSSGTLVMINGVRLNESNLSNVDWSYIPIDSIERIEIVRGPGNTLWGDNAVAGVINIITKTGFDVPLLELGLIVGSDGRFESTVSFGYGTDMGSIFFSGGYMTTDGWRRNGDLEMQKYTINAALTPTDIVELTFSAGYVEDSYGLPGGIFDDEIDEHGRRYSYWENDRGTGERFYTNLGLNLDLDKFGRFEFDYSYRNQLYWWDSYESPMNPPPSHRFSMRNYSSENGFYLKYILDLDFEPVNNRLTVGYDYRDYLSKFNNHASWGENIFDATRTASAFYIYDELTLFDMMVLSIGYRNEFVKNSFKNTDIPPSFFTGYDEQTKNYAEESFTAGITFLFGEEGKAYFRYAQGYRLPLLDELYSYGTFYPELMSEGFDSYEMGASYSLRPWISASLDLYWMKYDNEIMWRPTGAWTGKNDNFDETVHRGLELRLSSHPLEWLDLYLTYAFQEAFFDYDDEEIDTIRKGHAIPLIPKHTLTFGVGFDYEGFSANIDCRWESDRARLDDYANYYDKLPPYFVMDLRVGYTYTGFDFMEVEAFAGVDNVFGSMSSNYGGFNFGGTPGTRGFLWEYPLPETTWYSGVNIRF